MITPWDQNEINQLIDLIHQNNTAKEIASVLKRGIHSVNWQIYKLGLTTKNIRWTESDINLLIDLRSKNIPGKEIVKIMNKKLESINWWSKKLGIQTDRSKRVMMQKKLKVSGLSMCKICEKIKPIEDFHKFNGIGQKLSYYCNDCERLALSKQNAMLNENTDLLKMLKHRFFKARYRAKKQNREFDLDLDFLLETFNRQKGFCYFSGIQMDFKTKSNFSISIDRINSEFGYLKGNIVLCCNYINIMKNDLKMEDFINTCNLIVANFQKT